MLWRRLLGGQFGRAQRVLFAAGGSREKVPEPRDYEFTEFGVLDFEKSEIARMRDRAVKFPLRLREGHRCFGWRASDGQIASYLWFSNAAARNPPWMFDLTILVRPDTAYIWDCRTAPEHERHGLYTAGLARLRRLALEHGAVRVLIDCAPDNAPSIRAIEKAGFRRIADTDVRKIGPFNFFRMNAGRWQVMSRCLDPHSLGS